MDALTLDSIEIKRCELAEFKLLAIEYCNLVNQFGFSVKPFRDNNDFHFSRCNIQKKKRAILYLDANIEILKECIVSGDNPKNSTRLLWRILRKIKATPESDIFDKILETDVVEVYLDDHTQIFRNMQFFNFSSFTIDELLCGTWYKLYKRDFLTTIKMMKMVFKLLIGNLTETTRWSVPTHTFDEVGSMEKLQLKIELKYLSPLKNNGKRIGAICTSSATIC